MIVKIRSEGNILFFFSYYFSILQKYVDPPREVKFIPVRPKTLPNLRRREPTGSLDQVITIEESEELSEEDVEESEQTVVCLPNVEVDKLYVVLGDSLDGYYVVKCLSVIDDTFSGCYLKQVSSFESELTYKLTKHNDIFLTRSVISELTIVPNVFNNTATFVVKKVDLDSILLKIDSMI